MNGPLRGGESCKGKFGRPAVTANSISLAKLKDLMVDQYNQEMCAFPEDQRLMQKFESSIQFDEGHYRFDLPFKAEDVILPNNHNTAAQCILSLDRKFKRNK